MYLNALKLSVSILREDITVKIFVITVCRIINRHYYYCLLLYLTDETASDNCQIAEVLLMISNHAGVTLFVKAMKTLVKFVCNSNDSFCLF